MARSRDHNRRLGDATVNAFEPAPLHLASSRHYRALIAQMEDRRRFTFDPLSPPVAVRRSDRRVVVSASSAHGRSNFHGLKFSVPERIALCAKRKIRKEVLFAFKFAGRGGAKRKAYRRNFWSSIGC